MPSGFRPECWCAQTCSLDLFADEVIHVGQVTGLQTELVLSPAASQTEFGAADALPDATAVNLRGRRAQGRQALSIKEFLREAIHRLAVGLH